MSRKITRANRTDWIAPFHADLRSVLLSPNEIFVSRSGVVFTSSLCEHAAPQPASEEYEIIACEVCCADLRAGAPIAQE
jgi:hypothetical protein